VEEEKKKSPCKGILHSSYITLEHRLPTTSNTINDLTLCSTGRDLILPRNALIHLDFGLRWGTAFGFERKSVRHLLAVMKVSFTSQLYHSRVYAWASQPWSLQTQHAWRLLSLLDLLIVIFGVAWLNNDSSFLPRQLFPLSMDKRQELTVDVPLCFSNQFE
jgi:hypothetical protein